MKKTFQEALDDLIEAYTEIGISYTEITEALSVAITDLETGHKDIEENE